MPYLAKNTPLGKLEIETIIVYYDIPRCFTCVNENHQHYLVLSINEAERDYEWVYVKISDKRLKDVLGGKIDILAAFTDPEEHSVLRVTTGDGNDKAVPALPTEISENSLPEPGVRVKFKKNELPTFEKASVAPRTEEQIIINSFSNIRDNFSADKIIADPEHNSKFIGECSKNGLDRPASESNWFLMQARKAGRMSHLPRTTNSPNIAPGIINQIEIASELAMRYMVLMKGLSADRILCNPKLAIEFDKFAEMISPGFEPFEYRWTAFNVRKAGTKVKAPKADPSFFDDFKFANFKKTTSIKKSHLSQDPGVYAIFYNENPLFISWADSLRDKVEMHLELSCSRGLPDWLYPPETGVFSMAFSDLPQSRKSDRKYLVTKQVSRMHPLFNLRRAA